MLASNMLNRLSVCGYTFPKRTSMGQWVVGMALHGMTIDYLESLTAEAPTARVCARPPLLYNALPTPGSITSGAVFPLEVSPRGGKLPSVTWVHRLMYDSDHFSNGAVKLSPNLAQSYPTGELPSHYALYPFGDMLWGLEPAGGHLVLQRM